MGLRWNGLGSREPAGGRPVRKLDGLQLIANQVQSMACVAHRQARPPREVVECGGTMAGEITFGEFGQRSFAIQFQGMGDTFVKERKCRLFALRFSKTKRAFHGQLTEDVVAALT